MQSAVTRVAGRMSRRRSAAPTLLAAATLLAIGAGAARVAHAQTDYYNTDAGRPVQIEDAYALEHRGLELQAAPFRLERSRRGAYNFGLEPEIAMGILPRTQLEIGVPLAYLDAGPGRRTGGLSGIDVSLLYNLNVETSIPALGIVAEVLLPVGHLAPDKAYPSLKGIATKTFTFARFHVNGQYTFGDRIAEASESDGVGAQALELSQWLTGIAVDRTFPLRSLLITGEVYARQPLRDEEDVEYNAGTGMRYQYSPRTALDAGIGRRLNGGDEGWYVTVGTAYAFGLPWRR